MSKKSQVEKARATADSESEMANRLRYFAERQNEVTETIRQLVEIESPSDNKQAVDRLSSMLAGRYESGAAAGAYRYGLFARYVGTHAMPHRGWTIMGTGCARHEVGNRFDAACHCCAPGLV